MAQSQKAKRDTRTAEQAYEEHAKAIATLIETLKGQLDMHRVQKEANQGHWGYVGDIAEIHDRVATAVSFLAPDEE